MIILKNLILKELKITDITKSYINWLNDNEIVKFTELRYKKHTNKDVVNFVKEINKSRDSFLYGIFYIKDLNKKLHIGNIKIGPINFKHKSAYISYIIGHKSFLKKGIGSWAISEAIKISKKKFKLKKLFAGVYSMNIPSKKALLKNKFKCEGLLKSSIIYNKKRHDSMIYGLKL